MSKLHSRPNFIDALVLSGFAILITLHPFYLWGELNLFELGLYLPGIEGILKGMIPYRDFFYLRGPLELYMPALLMKIFGVQVAVLETYFYVGTVATLIMCVLLAKEILSSRLVFYLFVPVLVARTFPRVVFTYWGGMRYALGLLALWCIVRFFKSENKRWVFAAGIATSLGLLTSIEIGVCALAGIIAALALRGFIRKQEKGDCLRTLWYYAGGILAILLPFVIWLAATGSLGPYLEITYTVPTRLVRILGNESAVYNYPKNFFEAVAALGPLHPQFASTTPAYFYLGLIGYFIYRIRKKGLTATELGVAALAGYGMVMYLIAFRKVGGAQFEMALQPQKIAFFFLLERTYFFLREYRKNGGGFAWKTYIINFLIIAFIASSLGYSMTRYSRRFFAFQAAKSLVMGKDLEASLPFKKEDFRPLALTRAKGIMVPASQANDLEILGGIIQKNSSLGESVLMFPELGTYSFLFDRPFVGRFSMVTLSWLRDEWSREFMAGLKENPPRLAVVSKDPGPSFPRVYFQILQNEVNYKETLEFIHSRYEVAGESPSALVYRLKR